MTRRLATKFFIVFALVWPPTQAANGSDRLYRGEIEDATATITWPEQQRPAKRDRVLPIDPPLPRLGPDQPKVEVLEFVDYAHGRGRTGPRNAWRTNADELSRRWRKSLPPQVNVVRVPIASRQLRGEDAGQGPARTRLRAILTARVLGIEEAIENRIVGALDAAPDAVKTKAEARALFPKGITPERFENAWTSTDVEHSMQRSVGAYRAILETVVRHGNRARQPNPPILLINGEQIVSTNTIRRAGDAFRIANRIIDRELARETNLNPREQRWRALYEELRLLRATDIAYDAHPGPSAGEAIEIDPPLPTSTPDDTLQIEWFFAYLNRGYNRHRTTSWLTSRMESLMPQVAQQVPDSDLAQLRMRFTPVTAVPGHDGTSREQARMLQELALGLGYATTAPAGALHPTHISPRLHFAIRGTLAYNVPPTVIDDERDIGKLLRLARLSTAEYHKVAATDLPGSRGDAADHRLDQLIDRAEAIAPGAFEAPAYPIILIDGRYLVTGAAAGSYAQAARITIATIRRLLAERRQ